MQKSSFEIYNFLKKQNLLQDSPLYWWPNVGEFEVVVGAILTQNTSWKNVEKSLENLSEYLQLEQFLSLNVEELKEKIIPSGFYNQKAPRLYQLARNIKYEFTTFENFQKNVTRKWLLRQKGIGQESADAILCYACFRAEMVVDTYTKRLLNEFGIVFKKYDTYKMYLEKNMHKHFKYEELNLIFAQYHGMIVEYNKSKQ
ncbi:3-methyladenine DNA glycosylase [Sulfurimonas sp.]